MKFEIGGAYRGTPGTVPQFYGHRVSPKRDKLPAG